MKRRHFLALSSLGVAGSTYRLSQNTPASALMMRVSPEGAQPLLRFLALGDTGIGNAGQYAVAAAMTRYRKDHPLPFVLLNGDLIYNEGEIEKVGAVFEKPYTDLLKQGVRFRAALGNHDIQTNNGDDKVRYPGFNMQGRYYTFTQASVQFFALDTNENAPWKEQLNWLEDNLARSKAPWKVVFGHHTIYSSGLHGATERLGDRLKPLFSRYGVQLYLCGHDHHYERTHPIQKTTYVVSGAGAAPRFVGRSSWTAAASDQLSFAAFEVYGDRIEIKGIDTQNRVFDQGSVLKD